MEDATLGLATGGEATLTNCPTAGAKVCAPLSAIYPSLKEKRVVITGGASGIGAALVTGFALQGAETIFIDILEQESKDLISELATAAIVPSFHQLDLRDLEALDTFLQTVGPIDILINNAASDDRHNLKDVTQHYWDDRIAVNLRHMLFATKAVVPGMRGRGGGAIINFGSSAWHHALPDLLLYATAKSAIEGMTRALARELGPDNIRVCCVVPGNVRTPRQLRWYTSEGEAEIVSEQCIKARLEPKHVVSMVLFLASDEASMCTGHEYWIDGGWY